MSGSVLAALSATPIAPYDELEQQLAGELGGRPQESQRARLLGEQLLCEVPHIAYQDPDDPATGRGPPGGTARRAGRRADR